MLDKSKFPVDALKTPLRLSTAVACSLATVALSDAHQSAWATPLSKTEAKPEAETSPRIAILSAAAVVEVAAPERLAVESNPLQRVVVDEALASAIAPPAEAHTAQPRQWVRVSEPSGSQDNEAAIAAPSAAPTVSPSVSPSASPVASAPAAAPTDAGIVGTGQDGFIAESVVEQAQPRAARRALPRIMRDQQEPGQRGSAAVATEAVAIRVVAAVEPAPPTLESSASALPSAPVSQPPEGSALEVAQTPPPADRETSPPVPSLAEEEVPSETDIQQLQDALDGVEATQAERETVDFGDQIIGSPAVTISNPSGYGADNFEGFVGFSYQSRLRYDNEGDASMGVGIGLGDAQRAVGLQLSYTLASFGSKDRDFGTGGFNAKLHRQFPGGWSVALGWEGFAEVGSFIEFEDVIYGSVTHIIKTAPDVSDPFSRIAVTAGVGNGRFRTEEELEDDEDAIGVFGSVAVRIAQPVSAIVEWTGNDLAVGLSIVPFRNFPLVITPAVRDIAGAGDGARFVLGTGFTFRF